MVGIAFIRGINVGGKNILPMAALRSLCEGAGFKNVQTYIQSGNVVFEGSARDVARAARAIGDAIEEQKGFRPSVVVRTLDEMRAIAAAKVFPGQAAMEGGKLHVMFLAQKPPQGAAKAVDALSTGAEKLKLVGHDVFMHFENGIGQSKLSWTALEKAVGGPGTSRNWNTVVKMVEMGEATGS